MIEIRKLILAAALAPAIVLASPAYANAPSYYPSGPQQNVSKQTLLDGGWNLCWEQGYGEQDSLSNIYAACTGDSIVYAAGVTGSDTYMLIAAGPRSTVFAQTGYNETIEANGTYWYLNPNQSMGFAPTGTIQQSSADTSNLSDPLRMSWHTGWCGAGQICGGWRVGTTNGLNNNNGYTRAIWHSGAAIAQQEEEPVMQPAVSQEEYDNLQAQYDALSASYAVLQADYSSAVASLNSITDEYSAYISYAEAEFNSYELAISSQSATISSQSAEISGLNSVVNEKNQVIAARDSAIESYKATIDGKNTTIAGYIKKIDSLNEAIATKEATIADLKSQLDSANETIAILKKSLEETQGTLVSTEQQLKETMETLAKSKSDYELEKARSADLSKQLAASQARVKELESELADVKAKLKAMTEKQGTTQKQLDDALKEIDTLMQQLKDANATISEQKNKIEQLQAIADNPNAAQNLALAEEITEIALAKFEVAEKDSEEYEVALAMLAVAAQADDPDLPEEIAALPVIGNVAGQVLEVMNDLGNIGADIAPEQRERAEEIVVASVIAGNIAVSASAPAGGARRKI